MGKSVEALLASLADDDEAGSLAGRRRELSELAQELKKSGIHTQGELVAALAAKDPAAIRLPLRVRSAVRKQLKINSRVVSEASQSQVHSSQTMALNAMLVVAFVVAAVVVLKVLDVGMLGAASKNDQEDPKSQVALKSSNLSSSMSPRHTKSKKKHQQRLHKNMQLTSTSVAPPSSPTTLRPQVDTVRNTSAAAQSVKSHNASQEKTRQEVSKAQKTFLTFVISARRDDYGGAFLERLKQHLELLLWQLRKHGALNTSEVLIVEWNPVAKKPLAVALKEYLPKLRPSGVARGMQSPVRIITVPPSVHEQLANITRGKIECKAGETGCWHHVPFALFVAQNVGIRRARGDFVLVWNPDDLLSRGMAEFLLDGAPSRPPRLRRDVIYSTGIRFDLKTAPLPGGATGQKIKLLEKRISQDSRLTGTIYEESVQFRPELHQNVWIQPAHLCEKGDDVAVAEIERSSSSDAQLWDYFAGDFLLMSKESWERIGGFLEIPYMPSGLDAAALCRAQALGLQQRVLLPPCYVIHQHHGRASREAGLYHPVDLCNALKKDKTGKGVVHELQRPMELWGFPGEKFKEEVLSW